MEVLFNMDGAILLWIQENLRADWMTPIQIAVTTLGDAGLIWLLISAILLCLKKTRRVGIAGFVALFFSLILNNLILKNLIARTRPYEVVDRLILLTEPAVDFSFPSGHTGSSFAAAMAFFCMLKNFRGRWGFLLLAFAIGFSRLYIGIHYPTDVICGIITGVMCGYAAAAVTECMIFSKQNGDLGKQRDK